MKSFYILFLAWACLFHPKFAKAQQLRLGNNPFTVEKSAVLELQSDNQGLLFPRITDTALINSLSPPDGMVIFHSGSRQLLVRTNGYWAVLAQRQELTGQRINHVIVKSASDFPAPVAGIITLLTNTSYEINGTITLSSKIDLNGSCLVGVTATSDKLVYTGAGELFTGSNGGTIRLLTLTASSASLFNINAGGAVKNFILQNCYILSCSSIGTLKGFGGTVYLGTVAYFYNNNGITFENNTNVVLNTLLWDGSNRNTYEKFVGTFSVVQQMGGDMICNVANSAVGIDVTGVTSIISGELKSVLFDGTGTFKNGSFSKEWEVESTGLETEKDDVASGNLYISTTAATNLSTNTPAKISGTTTSVNLFRVSSPSNNRLTYTGSKTRKFHVTCSLAATQASILASKVYTFYIARNGVVLQESRQRVKLNSSDQASVSVSCTSSLARNDYVEVWVENNTDNTSVTVLSMNMVIK